jgi:hypothetical protein
MASTGDAHDLAALILLERPALKRVAGTARGRGYDPYVHSEILTRETHTFLCVTLKKPSGYAAFQKSVIGQY